MAAFRATFLPAADFTRNLVLSLNLRVPEEQLQALASYFMNTDQAEVDCEHFRDTLQRAAVQIRRQKGGMRDQQTIISDIATALVADFDMETIHKGAQFAKPRIVKVRRRTPLASMEEWLHVRLTAAETSGILDLACNAGSLSAFGSAGTSEAQARLAAVPEAAFQLTQLRELWMCNNSLASLPEAIGKLSNLTRVSLSRNHLQSLPAELCDLSKLRALDLQQNCLSQLPVGFSNLDQLERLNLAHNSFRLMPTALTQLPALRDLDISYNQLTLLSPELVHTKQLLVLNIQGNPLSAESQTVLRRMKSVELCADRSTVLSDPETEEIAAMLKKRAASSKRAQNSSNTIQTSQRLVLSI